MDLNTQLITAADQGDVPLVQQCLNNAADPLLWDSHALTRAVANNHVDVVKLLIPVSDLNTFNAVGLRTAMERNRPEIVQLLWDKVDHAAIMKQETDTPTPFQVACHYGLYDQALSVIHHPMHRFVLWKTLSALRKNTVHPQELQIWKMLIDRAEPRHIIALVESNPAVELPGIEILRHMYASLNDPVLRVEFINNLSDNEYVTHHVSELYPNFKDIFKDFNNTLKVQVLSQTLQHNMLFAQQMIEQCKHDNVQLLQPDMLLKALQGDMSLVNYCLDICDSQRWIVSGPQETYQYDYILSTQAAYFPHKVLRVLEKHPQFVTPKVMHSLLQHNDDTITQAFADFIFGEDEQLLYKMADEKTWEYWEDYKSRVQNAIIHAQLDQSPQSAVRKM